MSTWSPSRARSLQQPSADSLGEHERAENFPVALAVLPPALRTDLRAVYNVVRVIDELGDSAAGDRASALRDFAADVAMVWESGKPQACVLRQLVPTVHRRGLQPQPFMDLIQANVQDQHVSTYRTFDDLLRYCSLSAAPVGRIVLQVLGAGIPEQLLLSDQVCHALQLVEHWQDVAEDRRAGRIYLPQDDLQHFGVHTADLDADRACPALRHLVFFETDRAEAMLNSGAALVGTLSGWGRLAVAGYVAGGRAAIDSVRRAHGDVLAGSPRVHRRDVVRHVLGELRRAR